MTNIKCCWGTIQGRNLWDDAECWHWEVLVETSLVCIHPGIHWFIKQTSSRNLLWARWLCAALHLAFHSPHHHPGSTASTGIRSQSAWTGPFCVRRHTWACLESTSVFLSRRNSTTSRQTSLNFFKNLLIKGRWSEGCVCRNLVHAALLWEILKGHALVCRKRSGNLQLIFGLIKKWIKLD